MFPALSFMEPPPASAAVAGSYLQLTGGTIQALTVDKGVALTSSAPVIIRQRWNEGSTPFNSLLIDITSDANGSSTFIDCYDDGARRFWVSNGGTVNSTQLILGNDAVLVRQSAHVMAQRNGTNPQAAWIANTYTAADNFETGFLGWESNVFRVGTKKGTAAGAAQGMALVTDNVNRITIGATGLLTVAEASDFALGTTTGSKIGTATTQKLGFWNATPVVRPSSAGEAAGFTAGAGTAVKDDSTFTGNSGATAYRISDIVKHLKTIGILAP